MVSQQRIVIVGGGIVGLSTAYALLMQGFQHVTLLEQATVDHVRGTSHGASRLLRFEYAELAQYSEMVRLSLEAWKRLERSTRQHLYTRTGLLVLGHEDDCFTRQSYAVTRTMGLPAERISQRSCEQRFPQFAAHPYSMLTYNAEAGILHASTCLHALKERILALGGSIYESCRVLRINHETQQRPIHLHCMYRDNSEVIPAERVVLATGPWVHRLLRDIHVPVRITRQYLLYFDSLSPSSFAVNTFPAFITEDLYGFPMHPLPGDNGYYRFKAASHTFGSPIDPDDTRSPDEAIIARTVRHLREVLPALRQAHLAHVDSCMYDVSPDEDFILDRLPDDPRIVFATGLSGHGFKFGPLLGELMSSMLYGTPPVVSLERFSLARFTHQREAISVA